MDTLSTLLRVHETFDRQELLEIASQIGQDTDYLESLTARQIRSSLKHLLPPVVECVS